MKERWRASVAKAFPQGYLEGFPGYPLLGEELAAAEARGGKPWKLRLALVTSFPPELLEALLEDVEETREEAERPPLRGRLEDDRGERLAVRRLLRDEEEGLPGRRRPERPGPLSEQRGCGKGERRRGDEPGGARAGLRSAPQADFGGLARVILSIFSCSRMRP